MKYRVDLHGGREGQPVGVGVNDFAYSEGAMLLVLQFLEGACCIDVSGRQPYLAADREVRGAGAGAVGMLLLFVLGEQDLCSKVVVGLAHVLYKFV